MNLSDNCTEKQQQAIEMAWMLWEKIEELSSLLWDIYYEPFVDKCNNMDDNPF